MIIEKAVRVEPAGIVDVGERQLAHLQRLAVLLTSSPTLALRVTGGGFPLLGDSCSRSTGFLLHRAA
ncbi:hypothetical protein FCM34_08885 [Aeromonas caviae]|nr:hypothetical protein FCM34_08885 [Aeromonas caviae]